MSKYKLWIGVLIVFMLGALAGSIGTGKYFQHRFFKTMGQGPMPFPSEEMLPGLLNKLDNELSLTEVQKNEINSILKKTFISFQQFREKYHPEIIMIKERTDSQIKEVLNPEQRKKFENILEKFEKHRPHGPGFPMGMMGGPPEFMFERIMSRLNLNQGQEEKVRSILEEGDFQRQEILIKFRIEGKGGIDSIKKKMDKIDQKIEKKLEPILDKNQLQTYKKIQNEMLKHFPDKGPMMINP